MWLRRLYTDPQTGALVTMESRGRCFEHGLRQVLIIRDEAVCRTPWCTAPIRHLDHVVEVHDGGATSAENGQGLCETCNYVKTSPGWSARPGPDGTITTTTPTGHTYTSPVPRQPGPPPTVATGPGPTVTTPKTPPPRSSAA
jgi:HNH endonuclease